MKEILPKLELMKKIAKKREEEDYKKSEMNTVAIINKKNREKQKLNDIKNTLLNKKKHRENISNQYKRKDCAPVNLFDSGYLNKKLKEENKGKEDIKIKEENKEKEDQKTIQLNKAQLLINLEERILAKSNEFDEIFINKKVKDENEINNEKQIIFSILPFDQSMVYDIIRQNNLKINLTEYKKYTLNEIDI
jgi:hypothetical protein